MFSIFDDKNESNSSKKLLSEIALERLLIFSTGFCEKRIVKLKPKGPLLSVFKKL
jgi:hypothetical protein